MSEITSNSFISCVAHEQMALWDLSSNFRVSAKAALKKIRIMCAITKNYMYSCKKDSQPIPQTLISQLFPKLQIHSTEYYKTVI